MGSKKLSLNILHNIYILLNIYIFYRLVLVFTLSCVIVVVCYFVPHQLVSNVLLSICAVVMSSIDIASILITLARKFPVGSNKFRQIDLYKNRRMTFLKESTIIGFYIVVVGGTSGLLSYYGANLNTNFKNTVVQILGALLIVLHIWSSLMINLQQRFFFSVLKNPFFSTINSSEKAGQNLSYLIFGVKKLGTFTFFDFNRSFVYSIELVTMLGSAHD